MCFSTMRCASASVVLHPASISAVMPGGLGCMGGSSSWAGCRGCKVQGPGCHAKQPSLLSLAFTGPRPTTARHTAYAAAHQNNPVPLLCVCVLSPKPTSHPLHLNPPEYLVLWSSTGLCGSTSWSSRERPSPSTSVTRASSNPAAVITWQGSRGQRLGRDGVGNSSM